MYRTSHWVSFVFTDSRTKSKTTDAMINEAWLMVEWRLALCRKSDDITIDLTRCSTSINYGERLRPLINTGKLYFHYFLVVFFFNFKLCNFVTINTCRRNTTFRFLFFNKILLPMFWPFYIIIRIVWVHEYIHIYTLPNNFKHIY